MSRYCWVIMWNNLVEMVWFNHKLHLVLTVVIKLIYFNKVSTAMFCFKWSVPIIKSRGREFPHQYWHPIIELFTHWLSRFDRVMISVDYGSLARYVKLRVAHATVMPGTFPRHRGLAFPTCTTARAWCTCRDARAVMHAGIANWQYSLKSVAGKTFPAFPAHAQPANLHIW